MRHIGLFGGTFNPVHSGHLIAAQAVMRSLRLDEIRFIPAAQSPLKQRPQLADQHRIEMLELALKPYDNFYLDTRELARPGPSYTIDTLREIRSQAGDDHLYLLLGMDAWGQFELWRDWQSIARHCHVVVMTRPGYTPEQLSSYWRSHLDTDPESIRMAANDKLIFIAVPNSAAASSTIRHQFSTGQPVTPDTVPGAVIEYIRKHRLYQEDA